MTHHVPFPDDVYHSAEQAAAREGLSPEEWIVATISCAAPVQAHEAPNGQPLSEALKGLVGVVDSRTDPLYKPRRTAVGDIIAEKFRKQGIGRRMARLTDTGPLIALIDRGEERHRECAELLPTLTAPLVSTWPCITEAMHLLDYSGGWRHQKAL